MSWTTGSTTMRWEVPYRLALGAPGRALVVGLHGMGEDEWTMARRLEPLLARGLSVLVPRAPFPFEIRRSVRIRIGHAWYHYDGDAARFVESMARAADYLLPLVGRLAGGRPVVLVGFSQGAYLAYYVALRHAAAFAAVCGIAGRAKHEALGRYLPGAQHVRVLHLHGAEDEAVSVAACRTSIEALAAAGLDAAFRVVGGGHTVTPEMVEAIGDFVEGSVQ